MDMIIKNGRIITAFESYVADIWIKEGKIAAIVTNGEDCQEEAGRVIDAAGKLVFPGIVDCHSHFQTPGDGDRETFETGSRAAAVGGITTVVDMPIANDPPIIDKEAFHLKRRIAEKESYVDYALWGGYSGNNLGKMEEMYQSGAPAFKSFLAPVKVGDYTNIDLWQLRQGMLKAKALDSLLGLHCEDYTLLTEGKKKAISEDRNGIADFLDVHSVTVEKIAVSNAIALCRETGAKIHICHVSHPDVAELIREAVREGLPVSAETCPHYLDFTEEVLYEKKSLAKCMPPFRSQKAVDKLWDYIADGSLAIVSSDHSPCRPDEKDDEKGSIWDNWGGLNSIQFMMPFMYDRLVNKRKMDPTVLARVLAYNTAKVFGFLPQKGNIQVGGDADLVVLDPKKPWKITANTAYTMNPATAYEGTEGTGFPLYTILRGRITAMYGVYCEEARGCGQFVRPVKTD